MVERAHALGLAAIAITDHDTTAGVVEAAAACAGFGMGFLPGTEISCTFEHAEVHVVGLGVAAGAAALEEPLTRLREARAERAQRMVERLEAIGVPIALDAVQARAEGGAVGRLHIAQELLARGYVRTAQQAFDKYIGRGKPAYVGKENLSVPEAIDAIHAAGGVAVIAHPGLLRRQRTVEQLLAFPFDGLEAYHIHHSPGQTEAYSILAEECGLLVSGGSDCHGMAKGRPEMGKVQVPYACFERILEALASRRAAG